MTPPSSDVGNHPVAVRPGDAQRLMAFSGLLSSGGLYRIAPPHADRCLVAVARDRQHRERHVLRGHVAEALAKAAFFLRAQVRLDRTEQRHVLRLDSTPVA